MSNPLVLHHEKMGAQLEQSRIPLSYTSPAKEYWAVRDHSGLADLSHLCLLRITGKDRLSFLNGLLTNEVLKLNEGTGVRSALLNTKARVLADLYLYAREGDLLIDTGDAPAAGIRDTFDRFIITEDVQVKDITSEFVHLTMQGPQATENAKELFGTAFADIKPLQHKMIGPTMIVVRDRTDQSGYDMIIPNDEAEAVWQGFLLKGVTPVVQDAREILRLEAGYPKYGVDVDENTIILEAGYKDAISFTKGCYLGQEVVARVTHIGRVNKNLVKFQTNLNKVRAQKPNLKKGGKDQDTFTSTDTSPDIKPS